MQRKERKCKEKGFTGFGTEEKQNLIKFYQVSYYQAILRTNGLNNSNKTLTKCGVSTTKCGIM